MKYLLFCGVLLLGATVVSCKRREPPRAKMPETRLRSDRVPDSRRQWFHTNLVGAYDRVGRHDPRWDGPAKSALNLMADARADLDSVEADWQRDVATLAQSAVDQGCPDPLVRYAAARYRVPNVRRSDAETAGELGEIARDMQGSSYPGFVRFYAGLRAAQALKATLPAAESRTREMEQVHYLRRNALASLAEALHDRTTPEREVHSMCRQLLELVRLNRKQFPEFWSQLDPVLREQWPQSAQADLVRAWFHQTYAWQIREAGSAEGGPPDTTRLFQEEMKQAEQALQSAWKKDDTDVRTAIEMINVCTALARDRPTMEGWFQRAMRLAPNSDDACRAKLHYLKPICQGSAEQMLAFGRECVSHPQWGGKVPLTLVEAHAFLSAHGRRDKDARRAYWLQPEVWPDLRSAYERFFRTPQLQGWRQNYALDAYRCQAWDDLNAQLQRLVNVDYKFFGGREAFDRMVAEARAHAKP